MAVTKSQYIFGSFFLSLLSIALLVGAFISRNWVEGVTTTFEESETNSLNFGLFRGTFILRALYSTPSEYDIYLTCLYGDNVCAFSCKQTTETREKELMTILKGNNVSVACDSNLINPTEEIDLKIAWTNAGVYICTLIFLSSGILTAAISTILGVYNTANHPVEPLLGIFGLKIWNICAAFSDLMVLMFYGIHYETNLKDNLSFVYSMVDYFKIIDSHIGFSYWLVFGSLLCHGAAFGLLILRTWLISKEPPPPIVNIEKTDDTIFLY